MAIEPARADLDRIEGKRQTHAPILRRPVADRGSQPVLRKPAARPLIVMWMP